MVTFRNGLAIALFLFGASYLWLTPTFLDQPGFRGTIFEPKGLLAVVVIFGFAAASWGLFKDHGWWVPLAVASGLLGVVSVIPYWIWALPSGGYRPEMIENLVVHALGGVLVALVLLVPTTERWLTSHL